MVCYCKELEIGEEKRDRYGAEKQQSEAGYLPGDVADCAKIEIMDAKVIRSYLRMFSPETKFAVRSATLSRCEEIEARE